MDETWIYHYTPKLREGSKQWVKLGESAPKRPKTQQSDGKFMVSVFCNTHGLIFIDFLEKGKTITGAYYAALLAMKTTIAGEEARVLRNKYGRQWYTFFYSCIWISSQKTYNESG